MDAHTKFFRDEDSTDAIFNQIALNLGAALSHNMLVCAYNQNVDKYEYNVRQLMPGS